MRVLIFGTVYINTNDKLRLQCQWSELHQTLNPDCDLLLVDSNSPMPVCGTPTLQLGDNIGHLSRTGQDGWGRAFCAGLQYAIDKEYDYVVHVEGDSLLRVPVMDVIHRMQGEGAMVASVPVRGTKHEEKDWIETGLIFFNVPFVERIDLIGQYDWRDGKSKKYPNTTPEAVLHTLLSHALIDLNLKTIRDDRGILTKENIAEYDWITHAKPELYGTFMRHAKSSIDHPHQWYGGRTYAQHGDDLALLNIFRCLRIMQPSYIDVGAHHPFELSNTALLYQRGSRGINVEANPAMIEEFKKKRPEDVNLCVAVVGDSRKTATLHRLSVTSGINSLLSENLASHGGARSRAEVRATTVDKIVDEHANGCWPDLLSIDAEGMDLAILKSINYKRGGPKVVCVEAVSQHNNISDELRTFMNASGYIVHSWAGNNMLFVRAELQDWLR